MAILSSMVHIETTCFFLLHHAFRKCAKNTCSIEIQKSTIVYPEPEGIYCLFHAWKHLALKLGETLFKQNKQKNQTGQEEQEHIN